MTVRVLFRRDWGADPLVVRVGYAVPPEQFVGLALHHSVTGYVPTASADDVAEHARYLQTVRPDLGPDWPYSFGIGEHPNPEDAWIIEGRGVGRTGAHTAGHNSTRYGIALLGNYSDRPMTPGMVRAFRALAATLLAHTEHPAPTIAHRQVYATACPGNAAMAQLDQLQPPFTTPPMESQLMTITPEDRDTLGLTFVPSRAYDDDGNFSDTAAQPVAQHAANAHIEAQRARLAVQHSTRAIGFDLGILTSAIERLAATLDLVRADTRAARDELRSIAIVQARPPVPPSPLPELTAELLADALTIALRRLAAS